MNISGENFNKFCEQLGERLKATLPGTEAHLKMASRLRLQEMVNAYNTENAIKSAVLILFYLDKNKVSIPFILRPDYNGVHSGQVAFPGGRYEKDDKSMIETALREAQEEVNIDPNKVSILGTLTNLYIPPSNYIVTPVVAFTETKPDFVRDPSEVAQIIEAEIDFLFNPDLRKEKIINVRGYEIEAPYFDIDNYVVWGATAMMLSELTEVSERIN